jgi:hypothetical protein
VNYNGFRRRLLGDQVYIDADTVKASNKALQELPFRSIQGGASLSSAI